MWLGVIVIRIQLPGRMYLCNCNGIRQRDARAAIEAGARKPADIFRHCQGAPQCAKCVCDMRCMIQAARADEGQAFSETMRPAAEKAA